MSAPDRSAAADFYAGGLGPTNWAWRLAARVKPANIDGNMSVRANLWRALVDWGWGIDLDTSRLRRFLWVYRRLAPELECDVSRRIGWYVHRSDDSRGKLHRTRDEARREARGDGDYGGGAA